MDLLAALRDAVGDRHVLVDADVRAAYETDWTRRWTGEAAAVVRPADAEQTAAVVRACADAGAAVVPQGGNTGLVGGSVPRTGGEARAQVVLSLGRLSEVGDVDPATAQVRAGAGATLATLQGAAQAAGLDAGMDFAARESATLGGIVACDAGGLKAVRHGTARARVAGLRAVLADGRVVDRTSGLLKDNAGYDLPALLIGSEGTLGVVTDIVWRLAPRADARALALVRAPSIAEAAGLVGVLRPRLATLELLELMTDAGMQLVCEHLDVDAPTESSPAYLLIGCAAASDPLEELAEALEHAGLDDDAVVASDAASRERLMALRDAHTDAIAAAGVPHKLDVGVPLAELAAFVEALEDVTSGARLILFGHLGDGNLHVNLLGLEPGDEEIDEAVLELVARHGGTISAEHGVGVQKAHALGLVHSDAEIAAMRAIKAALDPDGVLNPGVVLPV